jgi:hypothetical protein
VPANFGHFVWPFCLISSFPSKNYFSYALLQEILDMPEAPFTSLASSGVKAEDSALKGDAPSSLHFFYFCSFTTLLLFISFHFFSLLFLLFLQPKTQPLMSQ